MYKIELRNKGKLYKRKFYQTEQSYRDYLPYHKRVYSEYYTVKGFVLRNDIWVEID